VLKSTPRQKKMGVKPLPIAPAVHRLLLQQLKKMGVKPLPIAPAVNRLLLQHLKKMGEKAAVISAGGLRTVAQAASGGRGCCRHAGQPGSCPATLKLPETSRSALKLLEAGWIASWRRSCLLLDRS